MSEIKVVTDKRKEIETILRLDGYNEVIEFLDYCRHSKVDYWGECSSESGDYYYYAERGSAVFVCRPCSAHLENYLGKEWWKKI